MGNVTALLTERTQKNKTSTKMQQMAQRSAEGNLNAFSGMFNVSVLNENEKSYLEAILREYSTGDEDLSQDLDSLISITAEVKAINNQAAILHGERVKKAHDILTQYRDGAFTAWLMSAYGNRQTPYNFMQYFLFYSQMPQNLHTQIESMPRQAIYSLASREGALDKKKLIVEGYNGETKAEVLSVIREAFPLDKEDRRKENTGEVAIKSLQKVCNILKTKRARLTKKQKKHVDDLLDHLCELVDECKTRR